MYLYVSYKATMKATRLPHILLCILLDVIGMASFLLPALGEFSDVVWAPVSSILFYLLFGGRIGLIGGVFDFIEEILPFTDVIPTFTIAWFIRRYEVKEFEKKNKIVIVR